MKLINLLIAEDKRKNVVNKTTDQTQSTLSTFTASDLKNMEVKLFECEEFSNTIRINYLTGQNYQIEKATQEPVLANKNFIGGEVEINECLSYVVQEDTKYNFSLFADVYSITLQKKFNTKQEIEKPGVYVFPTIYDEKGFEPKNEIRIIWNPYQLDEAMRMAGAEDKPKDRLVRLFESALNMEPNLECIYSLQIRCSSRSMSGNLAAEKKELSLTTSKN